MTDNRTLLSVILALVNALLFISVDSPSAADDYELFIARGIEKINEEKYDEALLYLEKAMALSSENPEAEYYAGIAYSRTGDLERAEQLFLKIAVDEQYAENVHLELGRLYYVRNECGKAENYLTKFMSFTNDSRGKEYAEGLIGDCREKEREDKPYHLTATIGAQYDSNVILEPDNPVVTADKEEDGRFVAFISAGVRPYRSSLLDFKVNYNFYQSLHFDLNDFDVQYHKVSPSLELTASNFIKPSVGYNLEYINFDRESYGIIHTYYANLTVQEHACCAADGIFEYRDINYQDTDLFPTNGDRRGYERTAGLKQVARWKSMKGDMYYFYSDKRAREDEWSYRGNRAGAAVTYRVARPFILKVSGEYERRNYREAFPGVQDERLDKTQVYSVSLQYTLSKRTALTLMETYTRNDSNLAAYDYDRNVAGLFFRVDLL